MASYIAIGRISLKKVDLKIETRKEKSTNFSNYMYQRIIKFLGK